MLIPERQSARMSKITDDVLIKSGTGCFIAVPIWQQWAPKGCTWQTVAEFLTTVQRFSLAGHSWTQTNRRRTTSWNSELVSASVRHLGRHWVDSAVLD